MNKTILGYSKSGKPIYPMAGGDGTQGAVLDALVDALAARMKERGDGAGGAQYKATPGTPSFPYYTGPNSLFGVPGLERDVISTRIQPFGLGDRLPVRPTNVLTPLFPYLTGFLGDSGSEKVNVCDDALVVSPAKSCIQTAQFGRFERATRTLEVNRLGAIINGGDNSMDLTFFNQPLNLDQFGGIQVPATGAPGGGNMALRQEVAMRMLEVGVSYQNLLSRMLYEGNPANNTGGGGYREFPGLDILIGTTKVDALTQETCPSLASDIKNFNYQNISLSNETTTNNMLTVFSQLMRYLRYNAENMAFGQTEWVIVMRPGLFWELTAIWACAYWTSRCQTSSGNQAVVDAADMIRMRDDMRNGNYLLVDGIRYNVILDNNIREKTNTTSSSVQSGSFASDIYIVPLTVRGGVPVTYWEFYDYRQSLEILNAGPLARNYFWTDGGRYMWTLKPPANWCIQWQSKIEPRIILKTPHLAGRIQNVQYTMLQHERDVRPTDPYFVNGGHVGGRNLQPLYADWGSVSPIQPTS